MTENKPPQETCATCEWSQKDPDPNVTKLHCNVNPPKDDNDAPLVRPDRFCSLHSTMSQARRIADMVNIFGVIGGLMKQAEGRADDPPTAPPAGSGVTAQDLVDDGILPPERIQ